MDPSPRGYLVVFVLIVVGALVLAVFAFSHGDSRGALDGTLSIIGAACFGYLGWRAYQTVSAAPDDSSDDTPPQ
jgi:threonine/homoserine/homoserine lactone efflux protein